MTEETIDIEDIIKLAREAGNAIMEIYESEDIGLDHKDDDSPLTQADLAANDIIVDGLAELTPSTPVISEETAAPKDRLQASQVWLVDPLDGTKEFVKRNGQFTVNIALIDHNMPIMGVVYAPAMNLLYWADETGAYRQVSEQTPEVIQVRVPDDTLTAAVSASHPSKELENWLEQREIGQTIAVGSSLKLCYVADGQADIYPRLGPTMEWDTAAGDAVVSAAGGTTVSYPDFTPMMYNKEDLTNPQFIAASSRAIID